MKKTYDFVEVGKLINDCVQREKKMNQWEREFLASIQERHNEHRKLSPAQLDKLDSIWEKIT